MFSRLATLWSGGQSQVKYLPLPSLSSVSPDAVRSEVSSRARRIIRQRSFRLFAILTLLAFVGFSRYSKQRISRGEIDPLHPPLYEKYEELELGLPQHNAALPFPEGSSGRFFYPANHIWGIGFNNVLQEHLLLAHLAYMANRTFVFDPYTWNWDPNEPYGEYNGKLVPSRIPWHAFLQGPLVGDSFPEGDTHPRAVRKEFFRQVCTNPEVVNSSVVGVHFPDFYTAAADISRAWADYLGTVASSCVEIDGWTPHIFDTGVFMTYKITSIYESLINSPILKNLAWSSLVDSVIAGNVDLLRSKIFRRNLLSSAWFTQADDTVSTASFPGLLALHVRRGDYEEHCYNLEKISAPMQGWYGLPGVPDQFSPPSGDDTEETHKYFRDHCWPTIDQMINRIRDILATEEGSGLDAAYIMTNGDKDYVATLKGAIGELGVFKVISSSRDMDWTPEGKYISQAIDMAIANRAQVFIGNGFSSLSSNVVLLRFKDDKPPGSNRMW
ncbi:hypothetical protein SCHPADRAFT_911020 [Schizopora paradoxa]|uniref:GDP-fucose protein O-fucosyltransferase n=1 Tax=Schizopora paradoxa TaxID=27342 RepID=A0A0H2R2A8_9AGAM|nr:hypothetical protein SCHPADRAFT_911020 [Schizopora paradoxa]